MRISDDAPTSVELGRLCLQLAAGAAAVVARASHDRVMVSSGISAKSTATDLVTEIDRASERWLVDELARTRPNDSILGEEGGARGGTSRVRWLLDPIDGTVNFVLGIPHFAVSVAAELDGVVVAGAVVNPVSGETFSAVAGAGARLGGALMGARRTTPLAHAVIGTGFGYDAEVRGRQAAVVAALLPRVADIRRLGSAALDLCFLAAGRLDGYFESGLNDWDHAAGGLVAAEAGCVISGSRGRAPSSRLYVAVAPALATELLALLEELGADGAVHGAVGSVIDGAGATDRT